MSWYNKTEVPVENTDKEIWREIPDDYYSPSIFVTSQNSIGISVGGDNYVMPVRAWHNLAKGNKQDKEVSDLHWVNRQTSPNMEDNIIVFYTGNIVRGTITRTKYGTFVAQLGKHYGEYMNQTAAIEDTVKTWASLQQLSKIKAKI